MARRVRFTAVALAVILGTAAGTIGLITLFRPSEPTPAVRPHLARNGAIAFLTDSLLTSGPTPSIHDVPIWSMNPNGTSLHRLRGNASDTTALAWSPDGRRLAFTQSEAEAALSVISADGSGLQVIVPGGRDVQAVGPAWSPNGRFLTFSMNHGNLPFEIYRVELDGRGLVQLTHCKGAGCDGSEWGAVASSWSPDGHAIVFERDFALYLMDSEGRHPSLLARCPHTNCVYEHPAWSPDGSRILYLRENPKAFWTIRPDGSGKRRIFDCGRPDCLGILFPAWSPDGTKIIFTLFPAALSSQLAVIDADGPHLRLLTEPSLNACCAAWQPLPEGVATSPSPEPSPSKTPSRLARILGPHCDLSARRGDFDGDGKVDRAFAYAPLRHCPVEGAESTRHVLTVLFGPGPRFERSLPECNTACSFDGVSDLNRDGRDELALATIRGASTDIFVVMGWVRGTMTPFELQPGVSSKGPSQPAVFSWGGSVTHQDYFECRGARDGIGVIDVISAQNYGQNNATWKVKRTRMAFDGASFRIVGVHHFTSPVKEKNDPIYSGDFSPPDLCGPR